ncbi:glycolate oxidase iron-sulfur subunit [Candidatus Thiomargarita nelsonii]|uniref:Glycolate oxidase iron-sulfur subunit n=1 Tax=Candidatus Thiomargarita nelsonii TaxID=1003181 RepID=A0A176S5G0_9GAMM|nr:glycolate oxidase iron-sulfur subunit [Candidatus Thiomargarita nelsonii]
MKAWQNIEFLMTLVLLIVFFPVYRSGHDGARLLYQAAVLIVLGFWFNALVTEIDLINISLGHLPSLDAEKAKQISQYAKDIGEILDKETLTQLQFNTAKYKKISFHNPCTLQHGQKLNTVVETILKRLGFELLPISDSHLCCGSAGTYSILQPELSQQLLTNKLHSLQKDSPDVIVTANIGCQMHLATRADVAVKHWIELIDEASVGNVPLI